MSKKSRNPLQIQYEIILKKKRLADHVLELLLEGEVLSQKNVNHYIPEMMPHQLSSMICELRNVRLIPILGIWTDDRIKRYWMTAEAISEYFDANGRREQIKLEGANLKHRRFDRDSSSSMRFAKAVNESDDVADEHPFISLVIPELIELLTEANTKISPSASDGEAQAKEECAVDIDASDNGGNNV